MTIHSHGNHRYMIQAYIMSCYIPESPLSYFRKYQCTPTAASGRQLSRYRCRAKPQVVAARHAVCTCTPQEDRNISSRSTSPNRSRSQPLRYSYSTCLRTRSFPLTYVGASAQKLGQWLLSWALVPLTASAARRVCASACEFQQVARVASGKPNL